MTSVAKATDSFKAAECEELTRRYGRAIFARLEGVGPVPFSPAWWDERLMEMTMGDEAVKLQLFRFVDVLPQLRSPAEVTRHLREYFGAAGDRLPAWMRFGLLLLPRRGPLARWTAGAAHFFAKRLARKFIAGSNVPEVLEAIARLRRRSLAFTVDLLGEATVTEKEADESRDEYLELIDGLSRAANAWPTNDLIDRDDHGTVAARQCFGQAVGSVQPVRRHRSGRLQPCGARATAAHSPRRS